MSGFENVLLHVMLHRVESKEWSTTNTQQSCGDSIPLPQSSIKYHNGTGLICYGCFNYKTPTPSPVSNLFDLRRLLGCAARYAAQADCMQSPGHLFGLIETATVVSLAAEMPLPRASQINCHRDYPAACHCSES